MHKLRTEPEVLDEDELAEIAWLDAYFAGRDASTITLDEFSDALLEYYMSHAEEE